MYLEIASQSPEMHKKPPTTPIVVCSIQLNLLSIRINDKTYTLSALIFSEFVGVPVPQDLRLPKFFRSAVVNS